MTRLPFHLKVPKDILSSHTLLGTRYCSLAGHLAAHMKLKNTLTGKAISLFVVSSESDFKPMQGQNDVVSGIDVKMWQEDGLFFATASR